MRWIWMIEQKRFSCWVVKLDVYYRHTDETSKITCTPKLTHASQFKPFSLIDFESTHEIYFDCFSTVQRCVIQLAGNSYDDILHDIISIANYFQSLWKWKRNEKKNVNEDRWFVVQKFDVSIFQPCVTPLVIVLDNPHGFNI